VTEHRVAEFAFIVLASLLWASLTDSVAAQSGNDLGGITGEQIKAALGLAGANDDESNTAFKLGAAFELGTPLGKAELNGVRLAIAQIAAAGGPQIALTVEDSGTPRSWNGVIAEQALHAVGTAMVLVDGAAAGGTMIAGLARDQILAFDGDRGVPGRAKGQDYLWGTRADVPDADFAVGLQYLVTAMPKVHRVALVYSQAVGEAATDLTNSFGQALTDDGLVLATAMAVPEADISEAQIVAALKPLRPDAIFLADVDPAAVLGAVKDSGLSVPVIGTVEPGPAPTGQPASVAQYAVATDSFDPAHASNDWAKLFVASYLARFGTDPDTAAANAYEDTFAVWTMIRRVLARGGDITSGARLQQELVANHAFKSLYGGDGKDLDELVLDPKSHAVLARPFTVYRLDGDTRKVLATSDMGGANLVLGSQ